MRLNLFLVLSSWSIWLMLKQSDCWLKRLFVLNWNQFGPVWAWGFGNVPASRTSWSRASGWPCAARTGTRWPGSAAAGRPGTSGPESGTSRPGRAWWRRWRRAAARQDASGRKLPLSADTHLSARQKSPSRRAGTFLILLIFPNSSPKCSPGTQTNMADQQETRQDKTSCRKCNTNWPILG